MDPEHFFFYCGKKHITWNLTLDTLYEINKVINLLETKSRMLVARGWGEEKIGSWSMGIKIHLMKMNKF